MFEWNRWFDFHHLVLPGFLIGTLLKSWVWLQFSLYSDSSVRCSIMENVLKSIASLVSHVITWILMFLRSSFPKGNKVFLLNVKLFQIPIWSWNVWTLLNKFLWTAWCSVSKQITYLQYKITYFSTVSMISMAIRNF